MSTTPTTPQWVLDATHDIAIEHFGVIYGGTKENYPAELAAYKEAVAQAIVAHAPPLSPPTDEAKLREVIEKALRKSENQFDNIEERTDRILAALAPHLSQCEPGDSELLSQNEQDEDAFNNWNRDITGYQPSLFEAYQFGLNRGRAAIKSAMRGEGKP